MSHIKPLNSSTKPKIGITAKKSNAPKVIVKKPEDEESICYQLECRTDWEIEHSMEIVIFNGNAVYLGVFGGHSPWREFSLDDKLNYINKI